MLASSEPTVPLGGGSLGVVAVGILAVCIAFRVFRTIALPLLATVAYWAALPVVVFLRTGIGVRAVSVKNILIGMAFIYLVGNMLGHNYHDYYRDRNATIWGAKFHFIYLVLFFFMAGYRRICAGQLEDVRPSFWGETWLAKFLPAEGILAKGEPFEQVLLEPLAVTSVGVLLVFWNWFGWYLILTAGLFLYGNLYWYYQRIKQLLFCKSIHLS